LNHIQDTQAPGENKEEAEVTKEAVRSEREKIKSRSERVASKVEDAVEKARQARERQTQMEIARTIESVDKSRSMSDEAIKLEEKIQQEGPGAPKTGRTTGLKYEIENGLSAQKAINRAVRKSENPSDELRQAARILSKRSSENGKDGGDVGPSQMLNDAIRSGNETLRQAARVEAKRAQNSQAPGVQDTREKLVNTHKEARKTVMTTPSDEAFDEEILEKVERMDEDAQRELMRRAEEESRAREAISRAEKVHRAREQSRSGQAHKEEAQKEASQGNESQGRSRRDYGRGR
jgi:hypothetical protein